MIRYTTPALEYIVEETDLSQGQDVYVTFKQELPCGTISLEKRNSDLDITTDTHGQITDTRIVVTFTQEESAKFAPEAPILVKVNWIDSSGVRQATETAVTYAEENLLNRVISYGD